MLADRNTKTGVMMHSDDVASPVVCSVCASPRNRRNFDAGASACRACVAKSYVKRSVEIAAEYPMHSPSKVRMTPAPGKKYCGPCGRSLDYEAFGKSANRSDGLQVHCRECRSEAARAWRANQPHGKPGPKRKAAGA